MKTVVVIFLGTSGRLVNHSALAHDSMTSLALALPALALASTSWNASKSRIVPLSAFTAAGARSGTSSDSISVSTLYPPCMVPRISTALHSTSARQQQQGG
eukprot:761671-Rhodomonas_salina.2